MTQIDFYILPDDQQVDPLHYTCRLIEKVYGLGHGIYLYCSGQAQQQQIDDMLWQLDPTSFIPHSSADLNDGSPIILGIDNPPDHHGEVMVNLAGDIPNFFSRFRRVAEIVPGNPQNRTKSRQNYRFYQERGYPLKTHTIKPSTR